MCRVTKCLLRRVVTASQQESNHDTALVIVDLEMLSMCPVHAMNRIRAHPKCEKQQDPIQEVDSAQMVLGTIESGHKSAAQLLRLIVKA